MQHRNWAQHAHFFIFLHRLGTTPPRRKVHYTYCTESSTSTEHSLDHAQAPMLIESPICHKIRPVHKPAQVDLGPNTFAPSPTNKLLYLQIRPFSIISYIHRSLFAQSLCLLCLLDLLDLLDFVFIMHPRVCSYGRLQLSSRQLPPSYIFLASFYQCARSTVEQSTTPRWLNSAGQWQRKYLLGCPKHSPPIPLVSPSLNYLKLRSLKNQNTDTVQVFYHRGIVSDASQLL